MYTDKNTIYEIDNHLNVLRTIPIEAICFQAINWDNNPVVRYKGKALLLDSAGHITATLNVVPDFLVSGDKILMLSNDRKKVFITDGAGVGL